VKRQEQLERFDRIVNSTATLRDLVDYAPDELQEAQDCLPPLASSNGRGVDDYHAANCALRAWASLTGTQMRKLLTVVLRAVPAVAFIEMALDALGQRTFENPGGLARHEAFFEDALKEFRALGAERLCALRGLTGQGSIPAALDDTERGYLVGLATARVLLAGMPAAIAAKVEL
jgi:hypothetical protein